ncbi:DUF3352 domain-containing protein [Chlorogloea sp. CCALA 695]|uniref:DUF3352 domain-containing protein n=1 Tax=Chlorogloea sp. CCALA 695 TaxID=2107693 RepID=UPI000D06AA9F|nr:DUF3352 domain-containing protein [Chlorogloea sp. CCALA 695]PSB34627.1 hypothetical protein C7B70_04005 [Chlorogloea sp. CCALA 695]
MNQKSFFSLLAVVIVFLTGIGGCKSLGNGALIGSPKNPSAAIFVSKQAPIMVSLLVNPNRLEDLAQVVASPQERRKTKDQLNQIKNSVLANTNLDYEQDIKPWVGEEITVAVTSTDRDRDPSNGQQPGYLLAIATKDAQKSRDFVELLFTKKAIAGANLVIEESNGIRLLSNSPRLQSDNKESGFAGAVVGDDFVLFANHPQVLKEAVNNVQAPDLNLTTSSQYQQALTQLSARKVGLVFLNYPSLSKEKQLDLATYESQIVALELNPQGLLAETTIVAGLDKEILPSMPTLAQPVKALQYIPAAVNLAISGVDLKALPNSNLQQFLAQVSPSLSITKLVGSSLAELQKNWGLNLQNDIFSWVEGEYALGKLPNNDWIFVVEKTPSTVEGIEKLNAIASTKELSITSLPLENQKVSAWTQLTPVANATESSITLKAKVQGVHTTVDNYEVFTTSIAAMEQVLKVNKNGSLAANSQFIANTSALPQPNEGYVYIDWQENQAMIKRELPIISLLEVAGKPFFNNLRSLTISSYDNKDQLLTGGVFFKFNAK